MGSFYGTNSTNTFDHGLSARYPMRLLFSSIHRYLDPSSGAALCTRKLLELLAGRGMDCRALTTGISNPERETSPDEGLAALELPARRFQAELGTTPEGVDAGGVETEYQVDLKLGLPSRQDGHGASRQLDPSERSGRPSSMPWMPWPWVTGADPFSRVTGDPMVPSHQENSNSV